MLIPTIVMGIGAVILIFIAYKRGSGEHIVGLKLGWDMLLQMLPLLVFALILAGMIQTLIPREAISGWVGAESGFKGLLIGTVIGGFLPGGPFVTMPIAV